MSYKRSLLNSVNDGRRRRPSTSIEDLNRTLEALEDRVGIFPRGRPEGQQNEWRDRPAAESVARAPSMMADEHRHGGGSRDRQHGFDHHPQGEPSHGQQGNYASLNRLAGELRSLREEMRQQISSGIGREFAALRSDIQQFSGSRVADRQAASLDAEFERLSGMIDSLSERGDDKAINLLRAEIAEVKRSLGQLAREDTVRSVGERWEELGQRWSELAEDLRSLGAGHSDDRAFEAMQGRLAQIENAVYALPESLSLRTLEDKLRTLAGVVDRLGRQEDRFDPGVLETIERRLDELSRALVASATTSRGQNFDPEPLERIEARIATLAHQIDDISKNPPQSDISDQINLMSQRVDDLAHRIEWPENAVDNLARQIAGISQKLESVPGPMDMEPIFRDMESHFAALSGRLDRQHDDALQQGQALYRDLERRIEQIDARPGHAGDAETGQGVMAAMERRFAELAEQLERRPAADGAVLAGLEERLERIAERIDATSRMAGVEPEFIHSLQSQVTSLSEQITRIDWPAIDLGELGPRLEHIERSIEENRDRLFEAARYAAAEAVRSLGSNQDPAYPGELAEELRSLEQLTRNSDERNAKTFAAIHDTLIKIVDRLGTMEQRQGGQSRGLHSVPAATDENSPPELTPAPREMAMSDRAQPSPESFSARTDRSPAAAASEAALAAQADDTENQEAPASGSLLGGIARALKGRSKPVADTSGADQRIEPASAVDFDQPLDPAIANQPLEPGTGAPDLDAIMRRVRDQRADAVTDGPDAAKSDFIAAARRAAQAAAAEAESSRKGGGKIQAETGGLGRFLPKRRKTMAVGIGVLLITAAALPLGGSILPGAPSTEPTPIPLAAKKVEDEQATQTGAIVDVRNAAPIPPAEAAPAEPSEGVAVAATDIVAEAPPARIVDEVDFQSAPVMIGDAPEFEPAPDMAALDTSGDVGGMTLPDEYDAEQSAFVEVPVEAGPVPLREAAQQGDPAALFEIGNRYAEGRGVEADMREAARWYEMAAEFGLAPAQYRIGHLHEKGTGVQRDIETAKTWYQLAAEQGNASAMHNLAVLHAMGADGLTDNDSAARWFEEAAELGIRDSQYNMGILAAQGIGMERDLAEAYKWFSLVAEAGDDDAAEKRDEIAGVLTSEQLERATAAAELWRAREPDPEANIVLMPDEWTESPGTTASIDMRAVIADIQRVLNGRGYDAGPVDGLKGDKTRSAIMSFQRDNDMNATGEIDEALVRSLLERR